MTANEFTLKMQMNDNSSQGFCLLHVELDSEGRPTDWIYADCNQTLAETGGYTREKMLGKRFCDLFPEGSRKGLDYYYAAAYKGIYQEFEDIDEELGLYFHIEVLPTDKEGFCFCIVHNIKRKVLESNRQNQELKQALKKEKTERTILKKLCMDYVATYYVNLETGDYEVLHLNMDIDWLDWERYPRYQDIIKVYATGYLYDEDRQEFENWISAENLKKQLSQKDRLSFHYRSKPNPDGHEYYEIQAIKVRQDKEHFCVLVGFRHIDGIMEKEKAEQDKLQKALDEANLRNEIISSISKSYLSIYRIDVQRDYFEEISNDDELHLLTGYAGCASEKLYQICDTLIAPEYRQLIRPFLNVSTLPERLRNEEYITTEYRVADGSWQRLRFIVKKRDEAGEVTHVLCTVRSTTDVKRRELDLCFAAEAAKHEAEMKTRFLSTMSHDIRTPLNGIIGMLNLGDQYADDLEVQKKIRSKAMESAQYLVSLVNDVLDMNKLQSGELKTQEMNFDLVEVLQCANQKYIERAAQKGVQYKVAWEDDSIVHPYLLGNPLYLERILSNIADNAVKFSHSGSTITVGLEEEQKEDNQLIMRFYCKDQGIGMSEEMVKRAFDMFSQGNADSSRTTYEGIGLGLAIAKQLAKRMGGDIELQSELGIGTTVIIELPFKIGKSDTILVRRNLEHISIQGVRALVVEDNELNMEIAKALLENAGLEVTCASDGQEAVEIFEKSAPGYFGVIYMDIMMPRMNGLDATRAIRALPRLDAKNIGIIAMSANSFVEDKIGSRLAGMNVHLSKPLDEKSMIDALRQCMAQNDNIGNNESMKLFL